MLLHVETVQIVGRDSSHSFNCDSRTLATWLENDLINIMVKKKKKNFHAALVTQRVKDSCSMCVFSDLSTKEQSRLKQGHVMGSEDVIGERLSL